MSRNSIYHASHSPKMPTGLVEVMEELSRAVLKNNPIDIYSFCANHTKELLFIRKGSKIKLPLSLDQKVELARDKVKERASLRQETYDKKITETINFVNKSSTLKTRVNATQYAEERIIKIAPNDLTGNIEHEIIYAIDIKEPKVTKTEEYVVNTEPQQSAKIDESSINNTFDKGLPEKDDCSSVENIGKIKSSLDTEENNVVLEILPGEEKSTNNTNDMALPETEKYRNNCLNYYKSEETVEGDIKITEGNDVSLYDCNIDSKTDKSNNENLDVNVIENIEKLSIEINKDIDHKIDSTKSVKPNAIEFDESKIEVHEESNHVGQVKIENQEVTVESNERNSKDVHIDNVSKNKNNKLDDNVSNNNMDLETAAITIQKVFRSFLFKNKSQSIEDITNIDVNLLVEEKETKEHYEELNINNDRRTLAVHKMDTMLQTVNEEKSLSLSTDDSSLSSAATIIQAHVRGFLVRNKFNFNKTTSNTSGIDSDGHSFTSFDGENDNRMNKTVLNIHIVPENGHFMSRDESILTSDLSLDGVFNGYTNLHPLGYDKNERRKQLKREDAIQSISPPSNNSGKLSEDRDSVKEHVTNADHTDTLSQLLTGKEGVVHNNIILNDVMNDDNVSTVIDDFTTADVHDVMKQQSAVSETNSDEMDVITPSTAEYGAETLLHSGECHDTVLPTKVSRNDPAAVREFTNVLVYILFWNNS